MGMSELGVSRLDSLSVSWYIWDRQTAIFPLPGPGAVTTTGFFRFNIIILPESLITDDQR